MNVQHRMLNERKKQGQECHFKIEVTLTYPFLNYLTIFRVARNQNNFDMFSVENSNILFFFDYFSLMCRWVVFRH